jgi:hypothetical protein
MLNQLVREVEARREVEVELAEALVTTPVGVLVLVEPSMAVSRLPHLLLESVELELGRGASVHVLSERLVALLCPNATLFDGWNRVEAVRHHFAAHYLRVHLGLGAWPTQGFTTIDVFGAAIAGLIDDRARMNELEDEDHVLEVDGSELRWSSVSDLLSG